MDSNISLVVTTDGHNRIIDRISFNLLETQEANKYCETINSLDLKGDAWVLAKIVVSENMKYGLSEFIPVDFSELILKLDDRCVQKFLREIDSQDLVKSLKNVTAKVQDKIFKNVSKRATIMLKEDMYYMGPVSLVEVKESQERIISIIRHLADIGELFIPSYEGEGEMVE